jgi:hypothetical protein
MLIIGYLLRYMVLDEIYLQIGEIWANACFVQMILYHSTTAIIQIILILVHVT